MLTLLRRTGQKAACGPLELDTGNPLARAAVFALPFNDVFSATPFDPIGKTVCSLSGTKWNSIKAGGLGLGFGLVQGVNTADKLTTAFTDATAVQRSFSMWFYLDGAGGGNAHMWSKGSVEQVQFGGTDLTILYYIRAWSVTNGTWTITGPSTGTWHHFALTYDGSSTSNNPAIYLDGSPVTVSVAATPAGSLSTADTSVYQLGNITSGASGWDGMLDNFCIWNRILTAGEVRQLYAEPYAIWQPQPLRRFPGTLGQVAMPPIPARRNDPWFLAREWMAIR